MDEMSEVKNVLYLSYDGMTDSLGQSQVLPYLIGLSKNGFVIHLISFEKNERFSLLKEEIQKVCETAGIHWLPQTYTKKPPLFSTIKDIWTMRSLAVKLVKEHDIKIVHCRSYLSALVGLHLKKKYGVKFLFDMRGFWADERIEGNIWSLKNPVYKTVYRFFKRKEIEFFQEADHIVSLTENGKNEIQSWSEFRNQKLPISVIPCCVDLALFNPDSINDAKKEALKTKHQLSENPILGYIGSIGTWYMLPEMLDFFKVWKANNPSGKFLFVSGENPKTIYDLTKQKSISKADVLVVSCGHKEVPQYISILDLAIFFIRPSYSKKASSPTKQGEIMAMGIPLVCNAGVGDTDKIVVETKSGIVIDACTTENYQTSLQTVSWDADKIREGAKQTFDLESGVKEYTDIYERLWKK